MKTPLAEAAWSRRSALQYASLVEAMTLATLVFVAVPLKHAGGWACGVQVLGPIHGLAFVVYAWTLLRAVGAGGWTKCEISRAAIAALVPLGGFLNWRWLTRKVQAEQRGSFPS